ncbi:MAG: ATP-binding protein [Bacteroidota bacterium]
MNILISSVNQHPFLEGGGSMGELIRNYPWEQTELGCPTNWPTALKISVSLMLNSPFPMHITWGNDYIQLYNDGYRPVLGAIKHPGALGLPIKQSFPEIWDTIGPMFDGVMQGKPVRISDFQLFLERNGYREECFFDFSYSPIFDESGTICGVLTNVLETSDKVKTFRALAKTQAKLKAAQIHTEEERDRLMQFFMQIPAGVCILEGKDFVFQMVNPLYQQLFPGRALLGLKVTEAIPELLNDPIIERLTQVMETGKTYFGTDEFIPMARTQGGEIEERFFDLTYQARYNLDREIIGILVFAIEVTERKREEMRKNDFIGIASHELKTPLTSLNAIVQLTGARLRKTTNQDEFLMNAMDRAGMQLKRMTAMINAFLNVSRIESGQIHLEKTTFNFTEVVIDVMEELELCSTGYELGLPCRDAIVVNADKDKIFSVVTNLMANAIKYSPTGGKIEMNCKCDANELIFSVKDSGIGIEKHDLPRIFERYYRVARKETKNISGFGIGLYLSAEIIRLHGGHIWVESTIGTGSTFFFSLAINQ